MTSLRHEMVSEKLIQRVWSAELCVPLNKAKFAPEDARLLHVWLAGLVEPGRCRGLCSVWLIPQAGMEQIWRTRSRRLEYAL